jgi:hypothetical protein
MWLPGGGERTEFAEAVCVPDFEAWIWIRPVSDEERIPLTGGELLAQVDAPLRITRYVLQEAVIPDMQLGVRCYKSNLRLAREEF